LNKIGLYFYNARFYDATLGRFTQADTIIPGAGNPLALDRYAYTLNNPLRYNDPSGHYAALEDNDADMCPDGTDGVCGVYPEWHEKAGHIIVWDETERAQINQRSYNVWKTISMTWHEGTTSVSIGGKLGLTGIAIPVTFGVLHMDSNGNVAIGTFESGFLGTTAIGMADAGIELEFTNAPNIYELFGNKDVVVGETIAMLPIAVDVIFQGVSPSTGKQIYGLGVDVEIPIANSFLILPAEIHGGFTHTSQPLMNFNIFDVLGMCRPNED